MHVFFHSGSETVRKEKAFGNHAGQGRLFGFRKPLFSDFSKRHIKQYHEQLGKHSAGEVVTVTAMRKGAEEYAEMTFDVTLGEV